MKTNDLVGGRAPLVPSLLFSMSVSHHADVCFRAGQDAYGKMYLSCLAGNCMTDVPLGGPKPNYCMDYNFRNPSL